MTIYLLISHDTFCLLSFMELHNMVIHMLFLTFIRLYMYYSIQNQLFLMNFSSQLINFMVLGLYEQYLTDEYMQHLRLIV
jgi:hypothetical protein